MKWEHKYPLLRLTYNGPCGHPVSMSCDNGRQEGCLGCLSWRFRRVVSLNESVWTEWHRPPALLRGWIISKKHPDVFVQSGTPA